jgi:hypothetical protein
MRPLTPSNAANRLKKSWKGTPIQNEFLLLDGSGL